MKVSSIYNQLLAIRSSLSQEWLLKYHRLLHEEHLEKLAAQLSIFYIDGITEVRPKPWFDEEIIPSITHSFLAFQPWLNTVDKNCSLEESVLLFEQIPIADVLLILGQRLTSASIRDEQAIPPTAKVLLHSAMLPFNSQIKVATRAWEKHIGRSSETFWGSITGSPIQKEETVTNLLSTMIQKHTWWNIFYHYKHKLVFELRVASGHGIRWNHTGTEFIGFLEPFLPSN